MIEGIDYFVHLVDFPCCSCGGAVMLNDDCTYTILINSRLSEGQKRDAITHELRHIEHNDFYRDIPLQQKEAEAG